MENSTTNNSNNDILNNTTLRIYLDEQYPESYFIFDSKNIAELDVCECYTEYGQKIGCEAAGCTSFDNPYTRELIEDAVQEEDYENYEEYEKALKVQFNEQFEEEHDTILGYNYWNGSNWATFYTSQLSGVFGIEYDSRYSELEDSELSAKILSAYEDKSYVSEGFGYKEYEADSYKFVCSYAQGNFWEAEVTTLEE